MQQKPSSRSKRQSLVTQQAQLAWLNPPSANSQHLRPRNRNKNERGVPPTIMQTRNSVDQRVAVLEQTLPILLHRIRLVELRSCQARLQQPLQERRSLILTALPRSSAMQNKDKSSLSLTPVIVRHMIPLQGPDIPRTPFQSPVTSTLTLFCYSHPVPTLHTMI